MDILKDFSNIDFLGKRKIAIAVSTVVVLICIASILINQLNFGIDFTGGTLVEVSYQEAVSIDEVRNNLVAGGTDDAIVQYFGTAKDVMIRIPVALEGNSAEISSRVMDALRQPLGEELTTNPRGDEQLCMRKDSTTAAVCQVQMLRVEFVGPQVGDELAEVGGLAMLYALIGILIYVTWRFEWRFAVSSVVALVHDVAITVGIFSLLQLEFSLPVLASVLAVIGYSLNDTIVVFDRIRENFRKMRKGSAIEIMNRSINQTLRRTVLTSVTTLLVVLTLFFLGGDVIHGFATALLIGVVVGTYSSIFVASPLVLSLGISRDDMMVVKKEGVDQESMT